MLSIYGSKGCLWKIFRMSYVIFVGWSGVRAIEISFIVIQRLTCSKEGNINIGRENQHYAINTRLHILKMIDVIYICSKDIQKRIFRKWYPGHTQNTMTIYQLYWINKFLMNQARFCQWCTIGKVGLLLFNNS